MTAEELFFARVHHQYAVQFKGRTRYIDLAITTLRRIVPIEVKINAADQENQCYDYWQAAKRYMTKKKSNELPVLYYLTPSGYFPPSANGLTRVAIDTIAFYPEILRWLEACLERTPENFSCRKNLMRLLAEVHKIIKKIRGKVYPAAEEIMLKFFAAIDRRFDEDFCKKYLLKRGGNKRGEIGDCQNYHREICKFFSARFSAPGISFYCTDAFGKIIREHDRELWFRVECHNGKGSCQGMSRKLCASFMIFDRLQACFDGVVDEIDLHDTQDKLIDFKYWYLLGLENPKKLERTVKHIMTETENLLRRFVYG